MLARLALYFIAGAIGDGIITCYYIAIDAGAILSAALFSALITIITIALINNLVNYRQLNKRKWLFIAAYDAGNGAGTALAMMLR